jgi:hypothetical protein
MLYRGQVDHRNERAAGGSCVVSGESGGQRPDTSRKGITVGLISEVRVRQPVKNELVGRKFLVAGVGSGFEGTVGIRLLNSRGKVVARGSAQAGGGMAGVGEFSTTLRVDSPPRAGTHLVLQVFGDDPSGQGSGPGSHLQEVPLVMFPDLRGWLLYKVESGDTLSGIVQKLKDLTRTTVAQIVAANPRITDPDLIEVGWKLRIPQQP